MQQILYSIIAFGIIHLIVGSIRGLLRYKMIRKYQYDYYDNQPRNLAQKIYHNLSHGIFKLSTLYASISIMILASIVFSAITQE